MTIEFLLSLLLKLLIGCGCIVVAIFAVCLFAGLLVVICSAVIGVAEFIRDGHNIFKKS